MLDLLSPACAALFAQLPDATIASDAGGRILRWNPAAARLYGWSPDEAEGRPLADLAPLPPRPDAPDGPWYAAATHRRRGGEALPVLISAQDLRDAAGALAGALITVRPRHAPPDVLSTALDALPFGVAIVDRDLRFTQVNAVFAARDGRQPAVYRGRTIGELFPHLVPGLVTNVQAVFSTGRPMVIGNLPGAPHPNIASRGHWLAVLVPIGDGAGAVARVGLLVFGPDAYAPLLASLQAQATLLDHAHVFVRDAASQIVSWNQGAERLYGFTAAEAVGRVSHELLQTRFPASLAEYEAELFGSGRWEGELVHRRRDGGELVVASLHVLLRDEAGAPARILEVNNDITATRRAEAALRESRQNLQHLIDNTDGVIWSMDAECRLLVGNRAFHERIRAIFGRELSAGERTILPTMPPAVQAELQAFYDRALAGEAFTVEQEARLVTPPRTFEYHFRPTQAPGGAITGITVFGRDITEQRRAELERRDTERKLAAVLDLLPVGVAVFDAEGATVYMNPALLRIARVEQPRQLDVQLPTRQYLRPDGTPRPLDEFATTRALRERQPVDNVETGIVTEEGELIWTRVSATPVDIAGWRVVAVMRDITEQFQAQKALQHERAQLAAYAARLSSLLTHAPIGISLLDTDLRFQHINDHLAALNGLPPEAHLGRPLRAVLPALAPTLEPIYRQVMETGAAILDLEITGETPAAPGEQRTWRASYFPVRGTDGAILGAGVVVLDITTQRRAEATLRDAERKLSTLFELLPVGVAIVGDDGEIAYTNPAHAHLIGGAPERMNSSQPPERQYLRPDGTERPRSEFASVRACRERQAIRGQETGIRGADNTVRWLSISAVPVDFPHWRVVTTLTDITQRRRDEAALAAHAEALSHANAELTRTLKLKDEFLAMITHELRTPLNVVLGHAETLTEEVYGPLTERQRRALAQIDSSGRHLLGILTDILDLTRIGAGRLTLVKEELDVDAVCLRALQLVQQGAQAKGVKLTRTVTFGVEAVRADERRLTQILVNLLDNAVKFTPAGGTVGLEVTADAEQEQIRFTVWDTGIGIAQADMGRLFQPFTQVDGRLSRAYEGVGLGLTLVRRLTALHSGGVTLTSTPGQGSRFTVALPWSEAENERPVALAPARAPRAAGWARAPRVLLVDDDEATVTLYAEHLAGLGCVVTTARTGVEALARVGEEQPDILVLDIQMPTLDGLAVLTRLRADPATAGLPVLAVTALAMPGDRERVLAAGATEYLAKPVSLRALAETMELIGRDGGHEAP